MVLLQHWGPRAIYDYTHLGGIGVNLFFVLSGFLICEILIREKQKTSNIGQSIKVFFIRRFLRIFPVYYVTILLYGFLFTTGGILIWNITYTNNILECLNVSRIPIEFSHLWSLCVEEQFYLFFPFLVLCVSARKLKTVLLLGIVFSVLLRVIITYFKVIDYNIVTLRFTLMCLDCLFSGALLAYFKVYHMRLLVRLFSSTLFVITGIMVLAGLHIIVRVTHNEILYNSFFRLLSAMLGFLLIGYSVVVGFSGVFGYFLENKYINEMGKISYGIYLFHPFIQEIYTKHFLDNPISKFFAGLNIYILQHNRYCIDFVIQFILTITISLISYYSFEIWFLMLKDKLKKKNTLLAIN